MADINLGWGEKPSSNTHHIAHSISDVMTQREYVSIKTKYGTVLMGVVDGMFRDHCRVKRTSYCTVRFCDIVRVLTPLNKEESNRAYKETNAKQPTFTPK